MTGDQGHETWIETETIRTPWGPLIVGVTLVCIAVLALLAALVLR